ncbi:V4R domain-containing protein [Schinkia azotoformans MEV2011]|uniref:V4R domain-containing protein n=1 Tax=Schinkia azotoformans MEV2011 TaxID=1348973 RepID=A0A072NMN7_SCHAZ|nr:XylR N-terminal domain-containing protein [Schinkia azotoformans]KEF38944.1 V4R domain-containing protein [Schinkia azotoformans MEV2011]MEC1694493.1 XylR N-terminal domain-containing protein [Schinkia azotoformans]MEC1723303.1 XylR N-terminal domain-containing protein [Schinkia azotoformans]MEC1772233.1 XylR N-terminal domain-containing protein [Schinkia azotoformans]MEC1779076.1 XylR N-terminal domain-containing protein [Schinkia azotoformans]
MTSTVKNTLTNIFSFFNNGGDHYFQKKRMVISSTDAWGVLRKDLIDTLGIQRAKRFLIRYGWNCGKNEARMLKAMVDWESDLDWLLAGSQMHQIGGRVFSYPEHFKVDMGKGIFDVSGYWIDSYEAKQHLHHYSLYHEPICYFLIGYGGGYTSECLGKKIIFKETQCVGKGDKQCCYVAKTLEEWGSEIDDELINYEEQDIADELDIVYRRVERQSEILHVGASVTKNLTSALLQGKGMDDFAKILANDLNLPVLIQNQYFDYIAHYVDESRPDVQQYNRGEIKDFIEKQFSKHVLTQTEPLEIKPNQNLLISPIIIQNDVYGYISIYREGSVFGEAETDFLERAASVCAVKMLNERTVIQTEVKMKGDLLEELFKGKTDPASIIKRFCYFGYNINQQQYVLTVEFSNQNPFSSFESNAKDLKSAPKQLMNFFTREETHYHTTFVRLEKFNKATILIPKEYLQKKKTSIKQFAQHCYDLVQSNHGSGPIYIGVSKLCTDVGQYSKRYKEANKAIEIAKAKNRLINESSSGVVHAEELGHIMILLDARKPEELLDYAHEFLSDLKAYDERSSTELLRTLFYYIENQCNLHKTAREMNVSISGMRYRIQRIEELMNVDLSKATSTFEIQIALQTYMVFNLL